MSTGIRTCNVDQVCFERLVLGCMDSYDSESRRIRHRFLKSTKVYRLFSGILHNKPHAAPLRGAAVGGLEEMAVRMKRAAQLQAPEEKLFVRLRARGEIL